MSLNPEVIYVNARGFKYLDIPKINYCSVQSFTRQAIFKAKEHNFNQICKIKAKITVHSNKIKIQLYDN